MKALAPVAMAHCEPQIWGADSHENATSTVKMITRPLAHTKRGLDVAIGRSRLSSLLF